jgi:hypothetical protein
MSQNAIPTKPSTEAADLPLLLTTAEAAAVLRLAPKTLRNWVTSRRGPQPIKIGSRSVYRRADILEAAGVAA